MSRNEWEHGEFIIPSKEWAQLKKGVREAWNKHQAVMHDLMKQVHGHIVEAGKGQRGFSYYNAANAFIERKISEENSRSYAYSFSRQSRSNWQMADRYLDTIFPQIYAVPFPERDQLKPAAPKAKDFPTATNKVDRFHLDQGEITFDDEQRVLSWIVSEGNRACDDAHEHPVAKALFSLLGKVQWTRGTGGRIVGNDEYNRDNSYEGGGQNYYKGGYGPLGKSDAGLNYAPSAADNDQPSYMGGSFGAFASPRRR